MYLSWKYLSCYIPIPIIRRGERPEPQTEAEWREGIVFSRPALNDMMLNNNALPNVTKEQIDNMNTMVNDNIIRKYSSDDFFPGNPVIGEDEK